MYLWVWWSIFNIAYISLSLLHTGDLIPSLQWHQLECKTPQSVSIVWQNLQYKLGFAFILLIVPTWYKILLWLLMTVHYWHCLNECTKHTLLGRGEGINEKNVDSVHFKHFPFFIIFMANYSFEKCWWCTLFEGGGVWECVCFIHAIKCWQLWTAL